MEWFEKVLENHPVKSDEFNNSNDLYTFHFDWIENNPGTGAFKLIIINGNEIKGFINLHKAFSRSVTGVIFNKKYIIKKKGLFKRRIIFNEENNYEPAATLNDSRKGRAEYMLPEGKKLYWIPDEYSNNKWMFIDKFRNELLTFNLGSSFLNSGFEVKIKDKTLYQKTVLLLIIIGVYYLITNKR